MSMQANSEFMNQTSYFNEGSAPLPLASGYVAVLGLGAIFAVIASCVTGLNVKYNGEKRTSEEFNTAGRSLGVGLTATGIVSTWTWAATILQSSNVAFRYGISGPLWYAAGASIQVLLFGIIAVELKRKAKSAHTVGEIVFTRWPTAHKSFLFFFFLANLLVMSMLILGGTAVFNALTGIDIYVTNFLMPVGFVIYTLVGGLKATIIAGYLNVAAIYIILCVFVFVIYGTDSELGSISEVWRRLKTIPQQSDATCESFGYDPQSQTCGSIAGNYDGSYMTILSSPGLMFGIINVVGNFGAVFCDQSYWQSAIAAQPSAAHKGYLLGGLCWFAVPFTLATSLGLANVALQLPTSFDEGDQGLVPAAVAQHILGNAGGNMVLLMVFMAVISTGSAELVSVSSLIGYDIYKIYINPKASGDDILNLGRVIIIISGVLMGALSSALYAIGISLGWLYLAMGVFIGSAVYPVWTCVTNPQGTANAAIYAVWGGQLLAIICWIITASTFGSVSVATLGENLSMLIGNLVALCSSAIIMKAMTYLENNEDYDFNLMDKGLYSRIVEQDADTLKSLDASLYDETELEHAKTFIVRWGLGLSVVFIVMWPALTIPAFAFSEGYFTFWVILSIIWGVVATIVCICLPLYEGREGIYSSLRGLFTDPPTLTELYSALGGSISSEVPYIETLSGKSIKLSSGHQHQEVQNYDHEDEDIGSMETTKEIDDQNGSVEMVESSISGGNKL